MAKETVARFVIPLEPVGKKNSQEIHMNRKTGRPFVAQSRRYREYEAACRLLIPAAARKAIDYPVNVKALYYRASRRRVDITNLHSALHDVLQATGVLKDDSALSPAVVVSTDGSRVLVDGQNPRTEVEITLPCEMGKEEDCHEKV